MATGCYGVRRLSDLLQEQQEPFLEAPQCRSPVEACGRRLRELCAVRERPSVSSGAPGGVTALGRSLLCGGYETARKALRWDLTGCFTCRLPRAGDVGDRCDVASELDGGRQLSPVSVLELHSDEESPVLSNWDEDDGDKPSTSASSPPSNHDLPGTATPCSTFFVTDGKIRSVDADVEGNKKRLLQRKSGEYWSLVKEHQAIVSGWETIAADISRIPTLVALDLSGSAREWRRVAGEEEARRVGQSIEAMIFEEVRWEAVRDMICLREFFRAVA
ncbi:hypothetical protein BAE44_0004647 [Dichanthelium oligosanthes]|uniref:DUF4378 domain-containing protein n=1 Tax=Dichanthelium oligosanthes TaxID=888268 RepID=A0A1E5WAH8_9POAL|nr:hypothetical protein BAE44_0004647 [Dichanthelium oligosanthes]